MVIITFDKLSRGILHTYCYTLHIPIITIENIEYNIKVRGIKLVEKSPYATTIHR